VTPQVFFCKKSPEKKTVGLHLKKNDIARLFFRGFLFGFACLRMFKVFFGEFTIFNRHLGKYLSIFFPSIEHANPRLYQVYN